MSDDRDAQRSVAEHKEAKRAEKNDTNDDRDTISIDKNKIYAFLKSPRAQWGIVLILLLLILSSSYGIRTSNIDRLVDVTNGENIPLALDPFYFMRVAQTYVDNGGTMPEYDPLRYNPERPTEWHSEIHPYIVANMFLVTQTFNPDITLEYMYVLSPAPVSYTHLTLPTSG